MHNTCIYESEIPYEHICAGGRSWGRPRPLVWAGAGRREGPRQASVCMRSGEGVAYLIGASKRNLKLSEYFPSWLDCLWQPRVYA